MYDSNPYLQNSARNVGPKTRKPSCRWQTRATLEIRVTGHSRASKVTQFDRFIYGLLLPSYSNFGSKMHLFRDYGEILVENRLKSYPTLIWHVHWGDPLRIFRRVILCKKVKSSGYQMVYISRSCFRSASAIDTIPAVTDGQTDRHVAVAKSALCIASRG